MSTASRFGVVFASSCALLFASGCVGGGGGVASFFSGLLGGSQGGSSTGGSFASAGSGSSEVINGTGYYVGGEGDPAGDPPPRIATVHNPEPASLALFGGGLVGTALWRRRKTRKHRSGQL